MAFLSLFAVASMPVIQVLLIGLLGAYLASSYSNTLNTRAREDINKVVYAVFTPTLMFASLSETVTLQDIISWWFMPINVGLIFFVGSIIGQVLVRILKIEPHLQGLVVAACSAGNLGNLLLIIIPAICEEDGSPFGNRSVCRANGLSYVSFSMALGGLYMWTFTYGFMKRASRLYSMQESINDQVSNIEGGRASREEEPVILSTKPIAESTENQLEVPLLLSSSKLSSSSSTNLLLKSKEILDQILEEALAPPTFSAIAGFIFGTVSWLKFLIVGEDAPFRVVQDSIKILGNGTIPCITLILGGNLSRGLRRSELKSSVIITVICVRFIILPMIGIGVVKLAGNLGYLADDPLYHFILMMQFALPPAMNISTMAQLLRTGQDECSVLLLWSYLVAALALTTWSMIFMWILSLEQNQSVLFIRSTLHLI